MRTTPTAHRPKHPKSTPSFDLSTEDYCIAVRHSIGGYDWLDIHTISKSPETCRTLADIEDTTTPRWADDNPVVRIARCRITVGQE